MANEPSTWTASVVDHLERLATDKSLDGMSSTVQWVGGRAWEDAVAVVYRQDRDSWLAGLYVESVTNYVQLCDPSSNDPASVSNLLFINEIDDPSGLNSDEPPQAVKDAFEQVDGVIHWRIHKAQVL